MGQSWTDDEIEQDRADALAERNREQWADEDAERKRLRAKWIASQADADAQR